MYLKGRENKLQQLLPIYVGYFPQKYIVIKIKSHINYEHVVDLRACSTVVAVLIYRENT